MLKSLPESKKEAIEAAFKASKDMREKERLQIIRLLTKGYSYQEVAGISGKSEPTIELIVKTFNQYDVSPDFNTPLSSTLFRL